MKNLNVPAPGLGTFRLKGQQAQNTIQSALEIGFRHIDTAQIYDNEQDVGAALSASKVGREDIFLTTKVWFDNLPTSRFLPSVETSLQKLQTDYVDLLLIHWPSPNSEVPMEAYLTELVSCLHKGHTHHIGVSNFTPPLLEKAKSVIGEENLKVNQIEVHPLFQNRNTVSYCQQQGINVIGYMPLGNGKVLKHPKLEQLADKYSCSAATIAIAWQLQQGLIPIPASSNVSHLKANFAARELVLEKNDMQTLAELDTNERLIDPDFAPVW